MPSLIGYARSERAERRLRELCAKRGLVVEVVREVHGDRAQPVWREMMRAVEQGRVSGVMLLRLPGAGPTLREVLRLVELVHARRLQLHAIADHLDSTTEIGGRMLRMLADLSQGAREQHGEATSATLRRKRRAGLYLGGTPFGWKRGRGADGKLTKLEPVPEEQAVIQQLREWQRDRVTQTEMAARLELAGVPTRGGSPWSRRGVQCALASQLAV